MLAVSLCDEVEILLDDSRAVTAESNLSFLPNDARNLAVRAVAVLFSPRRGQRTSARG
jgi:4-diphosphocytidyl-2C-methyl-D-erythritol kinase